MAEGTVYLSGVKQETYIAIDENSVEAATFIQIAYNGMLLQRERRQ